VCISSSVACLSASETATMQATCTRAVRWLALLCISLPIHHSRILAACQLRGPPRTGRLLPLDSIPVPFGAPAGTRTQTHSPSCCEVGACRPAFCTCAKAEADAESERWLTLLSDVCGRDGNTPSAPKRFVPATCFSRVVPRADCARWPPRFALLRPCPSCCRATTCTS